MEDRKFIFVAFACGMAVLLIVTGGVVYSNMPESTRNIPVQRQVDDLQPNLNYTQTVAETLLQSPSPSLETVHHSLYGSTPLII